MISSITITHAVIPMMYGFGDDSNPIPETVDLVEVRTEYNWHSKNFSRGHRQEKSFYIGYKQFAHFPLP